MSAGSSSSLVFPEELLCDEQVFDVACHPAADYLAVGMIDGAVALYDYVAIADKVLAINIIALEFLVSS